MTPDSGTRAQPAGARVHSAASPPGLTIGHALAVLGACTALFAWLFSTTLFGGVYFSEADIYEYYLPIFLAPITTWSSYEFSGLPAFADIADVSLYPLHLLFARVIGSWPGFVVSAYVLAAWFTYAYAYTLTGSRAAAAFAGLAWGLSEAMIERVGHVVILHAFVWLPLILLSIERLSGRGGGKWIAAGAVAVGSCVLAGHPQPAIYTFGAAAVYALLNGRAAGAGREYYARVAALFVLGGLASAVKALPFAEATLYMERQTVSYAQFIGYANTPAQTLGVLFPTIAHHGREAPLYVGLGTLVFAGIGLLQARRNWRAAFWLAAGAFSLLLAMGDATPVARLAYHLPLYDRFRVSPRHLFLFAFAAASLAALGIAAVQRRQVGRTAACGSAAVLLVLLAAGAAAMARWPAQFQFEPRAPLPWAAPVWNSGIWIQFALAGITVLAAILFIRGKRPRLAWAAVAAVLVGDLLQAAPYPVSAAGLHPIVMPPALARPSVHAQRLADRMRPVRQRLLAIGGTHQDAVVPAAFARVWQIPIAGGYGPMLLAHHSALAMMGTNGSVDPAVLAHDDAALDLLAVKYVLVKPQDASPPPTFERSGITWSVPELELAIGRPDCGHAYPRTTSYALPPGIAVSGLALVAHLRCADGVPQGATVAVVEVTGSGGEVHRVPLRAGIDIADRDLAAPGFRARHAAPAPFDDPTAQPHVYLSRIDLPRPVEDARLTVHASAIPGWMTIERLTVIAAGGRHLPQSKPALFLQDRARWREVERFRTSRATDRTRDDDAPGEEEYVVLENLRALPRAWMVTEVAKVAGADIVHAVRYSQLPGGRRLDPRRTALVAPGSAVPAIGAAPGSAVVTRIEDGRIEVEASSEEGGFLVLSETWHPGWTARIGGRRLPVERANFSLQGVAVPAGAHTVVFELRSATQGAGMLLSVLAALVALLVAIRR